MNNCNQTQIDLSNNPLITDLFIYDNVYLHRVCVWEGYPEGVIYFSDDNCPNVYYTTDCSDNTGPELSLNHHSWEEHIAKVTSSEDGKVYMTPAGTADDLISVIDNYVRVIDVPENVETDLSLMGRDQADYLLYAADIAGNLSDAVLMEAVGNIGCTYNNYFRLYPSPCQDMITLEFRDPAEAVYEIHNLNGQLIHRRPITSNSEQIDMTPYSKGIYFITVRSDARVRTEKVVKY